MFCLCALARSRNVPFQYPFWIFCFLASQNISKQLRPSQRFSDEKLLWLEPSFRFATSVLSPGVEPGAPVPQTGILSIKLREQIKKVNDRFFHLSFERGSRPAKALAKAVSEHTLSIHIKIRCMDNTRNRVGSKYIIFDVGYAMLTLCEKWELTMEVSGWVLP